MLTFRDDRRVDADEIRAAFDDVFDQAIVFHGYASYMRDYDVYVVRDGRSQDGYPAGAPAVPIYPLRACHCYDCGAPGRLVAIAR